MEGTLKRRKKLEYQKKWYQLNRERLLERNREYHIQNREQCNKLTHEWRLKNKDKHNYYSRQWKYKHPEVVKNQWKVWSKKNRLYLKYLGCKRRTSDNEITLQDIQNIYETNIKKHGTLTCYLCNKAILFGTDSIEHMTPLCRGGANNKNNIGIAHIECNKRKGKKTFMEYKGTYAAD